MSNVYVVSVEDIDAMRVFGVFETPMDAVRAVANDASGICSGHIAIMEFVLGAKDGEGNLLFYASPRNLLLKLEEVFGGRAMAYAYFPAVKERYKTAEELFEARRNSHCMENNVLRGFSAIVHGLFTDEEIVAMYERGDG